MFISILSIAITLLAEGIVSSSEPAAAQRLSNVACAQHYDIVGTINDGKESESINGQVFTDEQPFVCEIYDDGTVVDFGFNASSTDPVTDCTYDIARFHKATGVRLDSSETLGVEVSYLHYRVLAVPRSSDPDCEGLSVINVDPYVRVVRVMTPPSETTIKP